MAVELNAFDVVEKMNAWLAGEEVDGVDFTFEQLFGNETPQKQAVIISKIKEDVNNQAMRARINGTQFSTSGMTTAADIDDLARASSQKWDLVPSDEERIAQRYASTGGLIDIDRESLGRDGPPNDIPEEMWNAVDAYNRPARIVFDTATGGYRIATSDDIASLNREQDWTEDTSSNVTGAPQLGDLPTFASQAEIDQDRYDSTAAAGRAIMAGETLPRFSMATSPGTAQFFGGRAEMPIPAMGTLMRMSPDEQANYSAAARMFQKPEFGDLARITQQRWGGRRTAPTAVMGGMAGGFGGFNQGSSYMPSRAPRPMRAATARSQTPFGFRAADSGGARGAVRRASFNRPTRLRAAAVRSGRDGLIRGSTV